MSQLQMAGNGSYGNGSRGYKHQYQPRHSPGPHHRLNPHDSYPQANYGGQLILEGGQNVHYPVQEVRGISGGSPQLPQQYHHTSVGDLRAVPDPPPGVANPGGHSSGEGYISPPGRNLKISPTHSSGGQGNWGVQNYSVSPGLGGQSYASPGVVHKTVQQPVANTPQMYHQNQYPDVQNTIQSSHHSQANPQITTMHDPNNSVHSSVSSSGLDSLPTTWSGSQQGSLDQRSRQLQFKTLSLQSIRSVDFKEIAVDKERQLGSGAYGAVYHANCDQLECAAKIMHTALSSPHNEGVQTALDKFKEEIELLRNIRHPNIVQYLTSMLEPGTGHPVLFMELCDENLTSYLERLPPPYHEQISICCDVSIALAHLHTNKLYHRDLSSNNVLLKRGQAKITDFGMSKIAEFRPTTICPGNPLYMPPEALKEPPDYTAKLDVFSLGVLMVQIMTQKFPQPSNRYASEKVPPSSQFPDGEIHRLVPEAVRRSNHLKLIAESHPLKQVALVCLSDKQEGRPSAHDLSNDLLNLKAKQSYTTSLKRGQQQQQRAMTESQVGRNKTELEEQVLILQQKLEQAMIQLDNSKGTQTKFSLKCQQLKRMEGLYEEEKRKNNLLQKEVEQMNHSAREQQELLATFQKTLDTNAEKERVLKGDIQDLHQKFKQTNMIAEEKDRILYELRGELAELKKRGSSLMGGGGMKMELGDGGGREGVGQDLSKLRWEVVEQAPVDVSAGSAVTIGEEVYIASDTTRTVYCYHPRRKWSTLPETVCESFSLAVVDGFLVTVGGYDGDYSRRLYTYDPHNRSWNDKLPGMLTARREPITLSTPQYLIVAGGFSGVRSLDTIEVMTITDKQWTTCPSPLPHLVSGGTMALCDNQLYLAPITVDSVNAQQMLLTCPFSDLLKPPKKKLFGRYPGHWQRTKDVPSAFSSIVSFDGRLLAIGGKSSQNPPTYTVSNVWEFVQGSGTWKAASRMNIGRWTAIVAPLSRDRLIVVGGQANWKKLNSVEIASL